MLWSDEQALQRRLDAARPDGVALVAQVQQVGHDVARERAVGVHEGFADVQVEDRAIVRVAGDDPVDAVVELARNRARLLVSREDAQQQDLRLGLAQADLVDQPADAGGGGPMRDRRADFSGPPGAPPGGGFDGAPSGDAPRPDRRREGGGHHDRRRDYEPRKRGFDDDE